MIRKRFFMIFRKKNNKNVQSDEEKHAILYEMTEKQKLCQFSKQFLQSSGKYLCNSSMAKKRDLFYTKLRLNSMAVIKRNQLLKLKGVLHHGKFIIKECM